MIFLVYKDEVREVKRQSKSSSKTQIMFNIS